MGDRNYVYVFANMHGTLNVVNYDATNNELNSFLSKFDIWMGDGIFKVSEDRNHQEVWFEFEYSEEIWDILHSSFFELAFERMNTNLVFEYPY